MKIILIGKNGMLGSLLLKMISSISAPIDLFAFGSKELDITDKSKVDEILTGNKCDILINCSAYNDVNKAEDEERDLAFRVNGEALKYISDNLKKSNSTLIHFSSDYVFDGVGQKSYKETDIPNPVNEYGKSKLAGEIAIKNNMENYFILRTAWLYGPNGKNFVDRIIELGKSNPTLKVVNDKFGSPTYTKDVSTVLLDSFVLNKSAEFGTYHLVNTGVASRFDLAKKALELASIQTPIVAISSSEFPLKAPLPDYTVLSNTKLPALRPWEDALTAYLS